MTTTTHVTLAGFRQAFNCQEFNAHDRNDCCASNGQKALFDYLEKLEDFSGVQMELGVVSLCCEFAEYDGIAAVMDDYPSIKDFNDLRDNTSVIEFDGGLIVQAF